MSCKPKNGSMRWNTTRLTHHESRSNQPCLTHARRLNGTRGSIQSERLVVQQNHPYASMLIHAHIYNIDRETESHMGGGSL